MRRSVTLAALVLILIAARPADAQSPTTGERLDEPESQVSLLQLKLELATGSQFPAPLTIATDQSGEIIGVPGGLVSWAGELPTGKTFRLWCIQFDPSGFGNPNLIGLECGWTPG